MCCGSIFIVLERESPACKAKKHVCHLVIIKLHWFKQWCQAVGSIWKQHNSTKITSKLVISTVSKAYWWVQFSKLHLSAVVNFSSAIWTNKSLMGAVRCCTKPSGIAFCCGTLVQESDAAHEAPPRSAIRTSRSIQLFAGSGFDRFKFLQGSLFWPTDRPLYNVMCSNRLHLVLCIAV